ncbi:DUF4870 family protein [Marinomonas ostreistagni]|uniref:DUF4870 family protein n=1 Tax=Marinomonas ostreistagni TaxID=359209 RepID=UPI001951892F|nr:hypothetical protein [Marinomonas ostreistagni]MBM6550052.1 hypothetical protein [Marinomonas ostreistagni]
MSEYQENTVGPLSLSAADENAKKHALIAYALMVLGFFTGISWIAGFIWALVKKGDAKGTVFVDHYDNIIKVFILTFALSVAGMVLAFVVIGYFVLLATFIWALYRLVKGLAKLTSDKAYHA